MFLSSMVILGLQHAIPFSEINYINTILSKTFVFVRRGLLGSNKVPFMAASTSLQRTSTDAIYIKYLKIHYYK